MEKLERIKRNALIFELHNQGFSYRQIALKTGLSKSGVHRVFSRTAKPEKEIVVDKNIQKKYSTSLVYVKNIPNGNEITLRVFITNASSQEEALGKSIMHFNKEMENYNISCKVVIEIKN